MLVESDEAQVTLHLHEFVCVVGLERTLEVVRLVAARDHLFGLLLEDVGAAVGRDSRGWLLNICRLVRSLGLRDTAHESLDMIMLIPIVSQGHFRLRWNQILLGPFLERCGDLVSDSSSSWFSSLLGQSVGGVGAHGLISARCAHALPIDIVHVIIVHLLLALLLRLTVARLLIFHL